MREATRQDTPRGGEHQCVTCWRLFTSHSGAHEKHKRYPKGGSHLPAPCEITSRLRPTERRGLVVRTGEPRPELPRREAIGVGVSS